MNEKVDLTKILKDYPKGTKLYSPVAGEVRIEKVLTNTNAKYPIVVYYGGYNIGLSFMRDGRYCESPDGECLLFPSKDQRDWSKFNAPWHKKERKGKFDPNTLKPFDKVLVRDYCDDEWLAEIFTRYFKDRKYPYVDICLNSYTYCIPYNEDTKHLVGTTEEAPEFYRYWEE